MNKPLILDEVKRIAHQDGGKAPGSKRFERETGIGEKDWRGKPWNDWNNFGDILEEAGFSRNAWTQPHAEDHLLESIIGLIRELCRFPLKTEIIRRSARDPKFPSAGAFGRRWNKPELLGKITRYCETHSGFTDVLKFLPPPKEAAKAMRKQPELVGPADGYVYLVRSGKRYKVGHTADFERRFPELSYQSPESIDVVHKIRTDDPMGIEKYWHDRFADKRKRGEWFELTADDVKAFKRRKGFM